jgi:uncharacterized DUF497 family protein
MPPFEWDERKRLTNLAKHGVDFEVARLIFNGPILEGPDNRRNYGERRVGAYGEARGLVLFVIYTWRGRRRRLISARKAGTHEQEIYRARVAAAQGRQDEG